MKDTFYYQIEKTKDGLRYWKGEDSIPYVSDSFLFVADGSGGAGCTHEAVSDEFLKDSEKRAEMLFGEGFESVIGNDGDPALAEYWLKSFMELDRLKDFPEIDRRMRKKSGYYASRITGCLLVDLLHNDPYLVPNNLFDQIQSRGSEIEKQVKAEEYAENLAERLSLRLMETARKAGLVETDLPADELCLPTTLSMAFYCQLEDGTVDVICLQTGDSRIISLFEEGAAQLTVDDETPGGEVTNYISLTRPFTIKARYYNFKKPFVLFGVSDGCTDWTPKHLYEGKPVDYDLAVERWAILEPFLISKNEDEVKTYWKEFYFRRLAPYDDSASLAYHSFGLDDIDAIRTLANRRLEKIEEEYLSQMKDLLDEDYIRRAADGRQALKLFLSSGSEQLIADPVVLVYLDERERQDPSEKYEAILKSLEDQQKEMLNQIDSLRNRLLGVIKENWLSLRPHIRYDSKLDYVTRESAASTNRLYENILSSADRITQIKDAYDDYLTDCEDEINNCAVTLKKIIFRLKKPDPEIRNSLVSDAVRTEAENTFASVRVTLKKVLEDILSKTDNLRSENADLINTKDFQLSQLVKEDEVWIKNAVETLVKEKFVPEGWDVRGPLQKQLELLLEQISVCEHKSHDLELRKEETKKLSLLERGKKEFPEIIDYYLNNEDFELLGDPQKNYLNEIRKMRTDIRNLEILSRKQIELYEKAEKVYRRKITEEQNGNA